MTIKIINCPACGGTIPIDHAKEMNCQFCGALLQFDLMSPYPKVNHIPHPGMFPKNVGWDLPTPELQIWWVHYWIWKNGNTEAYQDFATVSQKLLEVRKDERRFGSCENSRAEISRCNYQLIGWLINLAPKDWGYNFSRLPETPPANSY